MRSYHVLRVLASAFDVTALCFYRRAERSSPEIVQRAVDALGTLAQIEAFPIPQEHRRRRLAWDHLRSLLRQRALTEFLYDSPALDDRLEALLGSGSFDLVHVDSLDLVRYLPRLTGYPVILVHHNVESELLRRRARVEPVAWRRLYLARQAELVESHERHWCERVALNVAVSERDQAALARLAPRARIVVVPNGVDAGHFTPGEDTDRGLVCVGAVTWFPNRDALQFLVDDILPLLPGRERIGPVRWVGRCDPDERHTAVGPLGVELTGYVADVRPWIRQAACYVVPLRVGGGTRLKILVAWAMGKAVVSTSVGCEGLDAIDGHNILIRDTPAEFARAVGQVLEDKALRLRLGHNARQTVEREYAWEVVGAAMLSTYRQLLDRLRAPTIGPRSRGSPRAPAHHP